MSDLFPKAVPVTVVTGEFQSGKTVFALTTGYPLERTLIYDNELSAETYHTSDNPFVRVDLPGEMARLYPKGYTAAQFYETWLKHMRAIAPGQYDVIIVDTIETIEDGLGDWVEANPGVFGHTAAQYQKMSGIFWNDVKAEWKKVIQEMKARCRMVILIVHMRDEYKNNVRTGKRQRRGKETLSELATLEVELVRKPGQEVPSARVHKHRFFAGSLIQPSSVKPTLPSWMPECTWAMIRGYMANPVEKDILPPEEDKTEELAMEKLRLQAAIAEAELAKAEMQAATASKTASAAKAASAPPAHAGTGSGGNGASGTGSAGNGATKATPKVLFWRKLRERITELDGDVTNPKAALEGIKAPWAAEALKLISAENWDKALQLDMSASPEFRPPADGIERVLIEDLTPQTA